MAASRPEACPTARYAHSLPGRPTAEWEPLAEHHAAVGDHAARSAEPFGWGEVARLSGRLHDIGKCSAEYLQYISSDPTDETNARGPDHSAAGAREAAAAYGKTLGRILAFIVAGHHAGLPDADRLDARLGAEYRVPAYDGWRDHSGPLPSLADLRNTRPFRPNAEKGFERAFLIRMLFSCLVDADFLETERFYAAAHGEAVVRGGHRDVAILRDRLRRHMAALRAEAARSAPTPLNALRAAVLDHAIAKAELPPGLFTLTAPTGGGKTLASLSFALEHAVRHGLRRVVYVIPFTSIIEQTASVFRKALNTSDDVLEHHASFDWEHAADIRSADSEGPDGLEKLRRAAENWDVPIVVATAVQFFESLFANRTSRCRKLHNLAKSVIILDEAQTLPIRLLLPCTAALNELAANYGSSVVLCTATQPALRKMDGFRRGFDIDDGRELAPDPLRLYAALKRVDVKFLPEPIGDDIVAARFAEQPQMLCIVNSRAHARSLFEAIRHLPGAVHLTTLMCPRHRRQVLARLRVQLAAGEPVRLVATSLIEAGVDIDFPEVWRAAVGIDSINQAGGRCNREGRLAMGCVMVFVPADFKPPRDLEAFWQAARPVLRNHDDAVSLAAINDYFRELYWQKGEAALDAATLRIPGEKAKPFPILPAIYERAPGLGFPFATVAKAFRMIDELMDPVIVPWKADDADCDAEQLLRRIASMARPLAQDLRRLQQYTVSIPRKARQDWLTWGVLRPVHPALGDALLKFADLAHYDAQVGINLSKPEHRSAESNII